MHQVLQNEVFELTLKSKNNHKDPYNEISIYGIFSNPENKKVKVLAFWDGEDVWKIRYSSDITGEHSFYTVCSDDTDDSLHLIEGKVKITQYTGENPLYKNGGVVCSDNRKFLVHKNGKPFFWLADTWWMCLCKRLKWPNEFELLLNDRKSKEFTVIMIVAGLYPDMQPFDDRGANEAGFPWDTEYKSVNPEYFQVMDKKFMMIVNSGLLPCLVGCWGFYIQLAGEEAVKKHWEYLVARYGAFPCVFCAAGEAVAPFYLYANENSEKLNEYQKWAKQKWTIICRYIKSIDPYNRLLTIHPTDFGHTMIDDESLIDLDMLQTGHDGFPTLDNCIKMISETVDRVPSCPVINSEACYEGICGTNYPDIQRFLIWACLLNGACGHTYGANGIWQVNSKDTPYGKSPTGTSWGDTPWQDAYLLKGSEQVAIAKRFFEKFDWWRFKKHPEWISKKSFTRITPYAAGIPEEIRIVYLPIFANLKYEKLYITGIEKGISYTAKWFDPINDRFIKIGPVYPDENHSWEIPVMSIFQDWVLVLEKIDSEGNKING